MFQTALNKGLVALEEQRRKTKRVWCNEQQIRLGRYVGWASGNNGRRGNEQWEEGEAFRKVNQRLKEI